MFTIERRATVERRSTYVAEQLAELAAKDARIAALEKQVSELMAQSKRCVPNLDTLRSVPWASLLRRIGRLKASRYVEVKRAIRAHAWARARRGYSGGMQSTAIGEVTDSDRSRYPLTHWRALHRTRAR
jgi:hypothetical protein